MSVKEEMMDKTIVFEEDESEKRIFRKIKRKYRLMLAFVFFLSIILVFMILPMVIGAIAQGLW